MIRGSLILSAALLPFTPAIAQMPAMKKAEAAQLYGAAGFPIVADRPTNSCGRPAQPGSTFVDLNGDGRPEALMVDANPACYGGDGRYFAVLTRDATGKWRSVIRGAGLIQAQRATTGGWFDMKVTDRGCTRPYRYDGTRYMPAGPCEGAAAAAPPKPAPAAKPGAAPKPAAAPAPAPKPAAPAAAVLAAGTPFPAAERTAIFRAAGAERLGNGWSLCAEDPHKEQATIENPGDLNGDGRQEAMVLQGGTFCYGMTGAGFQLVTKGADGQWRSVPGAGGQGIPNILKTRGVGGWPDIELGGPGFCFPVWRFNGREYDLHRQQYEGKPCKR